MSKKTQLAKRPQKPAKSRKGKRRNPVFVSDPFAEPSAIPLFLRIAGSLLGGVFHSPEPAPWWCDACQLDLRISRGGPPAGVAPFCPRCQRPMSRMGVKLNRDGAVDATCEDVTFQRLPAPAPTAIEAPAQSSERNPAVSSEKQKVKP